MMCSCDPDATKQMDEKVRVIAQETIAKMRKKQEEDESDQHRPISDDPSKYYPPPISLFSKPPSKSSADQRSQKGVHFVFVMDESGSMQGSPWQELVNAYTAFLIQRGSDQTAYYDMVSVVQFNGGARITMSNRPLHQAAANTSLHHGGGGTSFSPAMQEACKIMNGASMEQQVCLVFMSDGQAGDTQQACSVLKQQVTKRGSRLDVHAVAFGSASVVNLRAISNVAGPRGQFHTARIGQLTAVFQEIAGSTAPSDRLLAEIGTKISSAVSDKLILDFL